MQQAEGQIDRLTAEAADQPFQPSLELPPEVRSSQFALWRNRRNQYESQLQSYDQRIARAEATIESTQHLIAELNQQLKAVQQIEGIRKELTAGQWGSKIQELAATSSRLDVNSKLTQAKSTEENTHHELADLKAQREFYIRQWKTNISQELIQNQTDRDAYNEQMAKARKKEELVTLTSPADAIVLEVANRSIGAVINGAEPLVTLVPLNSPLEAVATAALSAQASRYQSSWMPIISWNMASSRGPSRPSARTRSAPARSLHRPRKISAVQAIPRPICSTASEFGSVK